MVQCIESLTGEPYLAGTTTDSRFTNRDSRFTIRDFSFILPEVCSEDILKSIDRSANGSRICGSFQKGRKQIFKG